MPILRPCQLIYNHNLTFSFETPGNTVNRVAEIIRNQLLELLKSARFFIYLDSSKH